MQKQPSSGTLPVARKDIPLSVLSISLIEKIILTRIQKYTSRLYICHKLTPQTEKLKISTLHEKDLSIQSSSDLYACHRQMPKRQPDSRYRSSKTESVSVKVPIPYVASYPADGNQDKHTIYRVTNLKQPKPEKVIEIPGQYDGIAFSTDKTSLYITNWSPAGLSKIDLKTGKTVPVSIQLDKALTGPADITVANRQIYIPDLPNSRAVVVKEQSTIHHPYNR